MNKLRTYASYGENVQKWQALDPPNKVGNLPYWNARLMRTSLGLAVLLSVLFVNASAFAQVEIEPTDADAAANEELVPWHFDLDAAIGSTTVHFVTPTDFANMCPPPEIAACGVPNIAEAAFRGTVGMGYKGFTIEGGYTLGLEGAPTPSYRVLNIGIRLDTSWDGLFSLFFRFSAAHRMGDVGGDGAHAGVGLLARPHQMFAIYGEISADITTGVAFNEGQTPIFSYATFLVGGIRFSIGP